MFSNKLTAVKKREGGCSRVRRDFVDEVSVIYTSGFLECVGNEITRWCNSVYCLIMS